MSTTARPETAPRSEAAIADIECIVLCGGRGTRLTPVVSDRPKAMAEVAGRPFLEWPLRALRGAGVRRFVLATGHLGSQLQEYFGDGSRLNVSLTYSHEQTALGTGGAMRLALRHTSGQSVLVVNGDSYCRADVGRLVATHVTTGARGTLLLARADSSGRYGAVEVTDDGRVTAFAEKQRHGAGWISAGIYVFDREVVDHVIPGRELAIETDLLPSLVGHGLHAVRTDAEFVDIGTPASYGRASEVIGKDIAQLTRSAGPAGTEHVVGHLRETIAAQELVITRCSGRIAEAAGLVAGAFAAGRKLLLCGNGGSAADCQHMAAEFMSRLSKGFERPALPAVALTTDTSFLTAFANDCGYEGVFARQVEGLGRSGDVLLCISTSGGSGNVVRAVAAARERGMTTIGLFGEGAPLAGAVDLPILVPNGNTQVTQECMLSIEHIICELVETTLFPDGPVAATERGDAR